MPFTATFDKYACPGDSIACTVDGFDIVATLQHDDQTTPDDDEGMSESARAAWQGDEWFYAGIVLTECANDMIEEAIETAQGFLDNLCPELAEMRACLADVLACINVSDPDHENYADSCADVVQCLCEHEDEIRRLTGISTADEIANGTRKAEGATTMLDALLDDIATDESR